MNQTVKEMQARYRKHNETHVSTRLDRELHAGFEQLLLDAQSEARSKGKAIPTRSSMTRAALRFMIEDAKRPGTDRKLWIADIIAELP